MKASFDQVKRRIVELAEAADRRDVEPSGFDTVVRIKTGCLSDEEFAGNQDGTLPVWHHVRVRWHLLGCAFCRSEARELRDAIAPEVPRRPASRVWAPVLVGLLLVVPGAFRAGQIYQGHAQEQSAIALGPAKGIEGSVPGVQREPAPSGLSAEETLAFLVAPDLTRPLEISARIHTLERFLGKYPEDAAMRLKLLKLYEALYAVTKDTEKREELRTRIIAVRQALLSDLSREEQELVPSNPTVTGGSGDAREMPRKQR